MELLSRDSLRIVHVDEDDAFVELGERWLKSAGFKRPIVRCADGVQAVNYFRTIQPDDVPHAILVDLHMPRVNGLGVLHWVRTSYREKKIAVYLLTSSVDPAVISRATADGVTEYIPKHTMIEHLIQKLDGLIASINETLLERERTFEPTD
jgi:CheY-like chemotaxis protein